MVEQNMYIGVAKWLIALCCGKHGRGFEPKLMLMRIAHGLIISIVLQAKKSTLVLKGKDWRQQKSETRVSVVHKKTYILQRNIKFFLKKNCLKWTVFSFNVTKYTFRLLYSFRSIFLHCNYKHTKSGTIRRNKSDSIDTYFSCRRGYAESE